MMVGVAGSSGSLGAAGDVRIVAWEMDGVGVLAYNYYPSNGDGD